MIGAIIGAGASIASSLIGGAQAKRAAANANKELENQRKKNEDWYNRRYNEDYTQTAEAQAAMTRARELAREQMAAARGASAVMGGTEAGVAAQQQAANKMLELHNKVKRVRMLWRVSTCRRMQRSVNNSRTCTISRRLTLQQRLTLVCRLE